MSSRLLTVFFIACLLLCSTSNALAQDPTPQPKEDAPMTAESKLTAPWSISYNDGSHNSYEISQAVAGEAITFSYTPVTDHPRAMTNSINYDAGKAVSKTLEPADAQKVWDLFYALGVDETKHAKQRMKGTGDITLTAPGVSLNFIATFSALSKVNDQLHTLKQTTKSKPRPGATPKPIKSHLFDAGLHRITARVDPRNTRSLRLFDRLGMRREGHEVECYWDDAQQEWTDEVCFAVLAREWPR